MQGTCYIIAMQTHFNSPSKPSLTIILAIVGFSIIAVYCTYVSIYTINAASGISAAAESLAHYRQALNGIRPFPYQWRLLGVYMVHAGEKLTGLPPHAIDVFLKTILLSISALTLFLFTRLYASETGALCAAFLYLLLTVAGFSDPYTIYFTNDYAMIACLFGAMYFLRTDRFVLAAALTFVGAFAKETMLLVPLFAVLRTLRDRSWYRAALLTAIAFIVPTAILRGIYHAPISKWAWWRMAFVSVPFLQSNLHAFAITLKANLKVLLFYNVFWILAARHASRTKDGFTKDLAVMAVIYLVLVYPVIYIAELRHFLPIAIVVLPAAIAEIETKTTAFEGSRTLT